MEGMDRALNRNDRGNIGLPFRPDDGGRRIKHGNVSGFMAIALFLIDRLNTRKRQGRIASGLDLLTQGGLVILELNDQMRVRRCRCFEGFF